jgi:isopentenyldiphosphate isomerase
MDELVDILDGNGNYTGKTALKSRAHQLGLFHSTIHVWCYSKSGSILLQQRGTTKSTYPSLWDVSVAGHIGAGEPPETAAYRETQEEIGITIDISKLEKIGVFLMEKKHSERLWDREFNHTYLYCLDEKIQLTKQKSEVEALEWISIEDFELRIEKNDPQFVPNSTQRYLNILKEIRLRL